MKGLIVGFGALVLAGLPTKGSAQEHTFTIQHFLGPTSPAQTVLIEPWAKRVSEASGGRLAFEIFPSMALGGRPPELYSQVRDGTVDIVWTLPGYTPGVFPRLEVFELPGVHKKSAKVTTLAIQDMMGALAPDLEAVKPLLVHVHAGNALFLTRPPIEDLAGAAGLKVRSPSRTGAMMVEAWGAEPVGMPVPELPTAISRGAVDGALIPFEVALPLKITEMAESAVELSEGDRFGTAVFLFAMNKERYDALPDDLKAIIDDHSGVAIAGEIGAAWDEMERRGEGAAETAGMDLSRLWDEASADFAEVHAKVRADWAAQVSEEGVGGQDLIDAAMQAIARHE